MIDANQIRIVILDEDHVMDLVRRGMTDPNPTEDSAIRAFFAPEEEFDPAEIRGMAHGLRPGDGVEVIRAVGDPTRVVGAHVILFRRGGVNAAMIDACPDLRLVQRLGERSSTIDLGALRARGVPVSCVSRASLARTAEHAILLMLALAKRLPDAEHALRIGAYDAEKVASPDKIAANWVGLPRVSGLHGRTLGIVGLGEVGTLVARMASAFRMKILYTSRNPLPPDAEAELGVSFRPLDALMAEADFVSLHAPNTPQTHGLISAGALARMKPTSFLVNTARGALVDEDALYSALRHDRIAGAGLDVHAVEPRPKDDRFCTLPNVILTPHLAGGSRRALLPEIGAIYDNIRAVIGGSDSLHDRVI